MAKTFAGNPIGRALRNIRSNITKRDFRPIARIGTGMRTSGGAMRKPIPALLLTLLSAALLLGGTPLIARASSHREAPLITEMPKVDGTDFYMFRSYQPGRASFVTIVADYLPLQDAFGGPNYFEMDPDALYEIMIDNDGDAREEITFQFRFTNTRKNIALDVGGSEVAVPLVNVGPVSASGANLNVIETYTVNIVRGDRRSGKSAPITNANTGSAVFTKPVDNIGMKSIADYAGYAANFIYEINIPGCSTPGSRLFVGQRKDPFVVDLGETFDLINIKKPIALSPADESAEPDALAEKNVTSLILEVPINCLVSDSNHPTIAAWTTASVPKNTVPAADKLSETSGPFTQVSRLANPLVNELVIGLKDKDRFNASEPRNDAQFATYVTNPTLPALVQALFGSATPPCSPGGIKAPTLFPRTDLVAAFLTGVKGLNQDGSTAELMRLNTSVAPTPAGSQSRLGVIGGDNAGFPNGRRPGDDVVDIALRVVMGRLISLGLFGTASQAPSGSCDFTDGAFVDASHFDSTVPYIKTPIPGSPNGVSD
jgi:hypothetical protein